MARGLPSGLSERVRPDAPAGPKIVRTRLPTAMPTLWIVHRDAGRRAVLSRLSGAGEDTILGDPTDRLFEGSPPADVVLLGLAGDFEAELEFAHRYAPRVARARWILVVESVDQADARRLFDTLDAEIVVFPPSAEGLRQRLRSALVRRMSEPLSERRTRDAIAARFARCFASIELPEILRALDPRLARAPVLIHGESGTGRTLVALYLHAFGGTTGSALVQIACHPGLDAESLRAMIGAAARADRACGSLTVLLENVGRLPVGAQHELRGWIELAAPPVVPHSAWVRWIATLEKAPGADDAGLDPDLQQALAAIPIRLPALRDSPERIRALAEDVALAFSEASGTRPRGMRDDATALLAQYPWPGNLRELEAVITRSLAACACETIEPGCLRFDTEPLISPHAAHAVYEATDAWETTPAPVVRAADRPATPPARERATPEEETWHLMSEASEASVPETPGPAPRSRTDASEAGRGAAQAPAFQAAPAEFVGDQALRRFLAAVSHELGNSVVPLRTAAELLPECFGDPEFRVRFGEIVQTDSRRIEEVLARLSSFASFGPPVRSEVDLSGLLDALVEEERPDLEARQILLLRELERAQPLVLGDAAQIRFAFEGLLRKSIRLVKQRGDVYVASRFHPHGLRGAPSIRVLLRFESAARITPAGAAEGVSLSETALDLLLSEAVVRAHGGRFALDATEGSETVVLIDLPAPEKAPGHHESAR